MSNIKDVAALAGVSVTTVSRVLNKRGYISKEVFAKVYDAMERLDYQPNQIARSLYSQKTNCVGVLIPDVSHPFLQRSLSASKENSISRDIESSSAMPSAMASGNKNTCLCFGRIR